MSGACICAAEKHESHLLGCPRRVPDSHWERKRLGIYPEGNVIPPEALGKPKDYTDAIKKLDDTLALKAAQRLLLRELRVRLALSHTR